MLMTSSKAAVAHPFNPVRLWCHGEHVQCGTCQESVKAHHDAWSNEVRAVVCQQCRSEQRMPVFRHGLRWLTGEARDQTRGA